jgi:hypothetical protein
VAPDCIEGLDGETAIATKLVADGKNFPQAAASSAGKMMKASL